MFELILYEPQPVIQISVLYLLKFIFTTYVIIKHVLQYCDRCMQLTVKDLLDTIVLYYFLTQMIVSMDDSVSVDCFSMLLFTIVAEYLARTHTMSRIVCLPSPSFGRRLLKLQLNEKAHHQSPQFTVLFNKYVRLVQC